ncbi:hypothetical protein, partial [Gluconobacter sp.]|uniref:hypothetical protein n=1 Tax=Gluconobacter sp. TaxID=1876758 RepID=UPI0039E8D9C7
MTDLKGHDCKLLSSIRMVLERISGDIFVQIAQPNLTRNIPHSLKDYRFLFAASDRPPHLYGKLVT